MLAGRTVKNRRKRSPCKEYYALTLHELGRRALTNRLRGTSTLLKNRTRFPFRFRSVHLGIRLCSRSKRVFQQTASSACCFSGEHFVATAGHTTFRNSCHNFPVSFRSVNHTLLIVSLLFHIFIMQ